MFREIEDDDWLAILEVANASYAFMAPPITQEEWLHNRRNFDHGRGSQYQRVHVDDAGRIDGYVAVESNGSQYRIFMVTANANLERLGPALYEHVMAKLAEYRAPGVALTEAVGDPLLPFGEARGFRELRRQEWKPGIDCVTLYKTLSWPES